MAEYLPLLHSEQPDWAQESWYLPGEQLKHAVKVDEFVAVLENVPRCGVESSASSECRGNGRGANATGAERARSAAHKTRIAAKRARRRSGGARRPRTARRALETIIVAAGGNEGFTDGARGAPNLTHIARPAR